MPILSDAARNWSLRGTMARRLHRPALWVFGYGSLMWDPRFDAAEARIATLHGYRRSFCFLTTMARGSPENPGLGLGLLHGGRSAGIAFRLAPATLAADLQALWRREMFSGVYVPRWVRVATAAGPVEALTFIANPRHPVYVGPQDFDITVDRIGTAAGSRGSCREYLENLVGVLARLGRPDRDLLHLVAEIHRRHPQI